jgi:hypothetical protein
LVSPGGDAVLECQRAGVPLALVDTRRADPGLVGRVADARLELVVEPGALAPPHGGWLVDLDTAELHRLPGPVSGVRRGLLFYSPTAPAADPPPVPGPPFAPYEDAAPGTLPLELHGLRLAPVAGDDGVVTVELPGAAARAVPRPGLARHLFRVAQHGYRLGRDETYGGRRLDDTGPALLVSLPGAPPLELPREALEPLYRAAAPPGYRERPPR